MPRRKKASFPRPGSGDPGDWLKKAVHTAPRPLPPGYFPKILLASEQEGFSRDALLDVVDMWLNYGYCRILDPITQDIEITQSGESFFY